MRSQVYSTAGEMACFAIPNDCNVIWVSGCGGGGGGGGGNSASGATGGGASPYFFRVPLTVNAGGAIMVHVGVGGAGGASGGSGASFSSENYVRCSAVVGRDILSPLIMPYTYALYLGYGSNGWQSAGGGTGLPETIVVNTANVNRLTPTNVNAADWSYAANTFHAFVMPPSVTGDAGRAGPSNPYAYGVAGFATFNDMGLGPESASDATYGSGGAGGGGLFGRGGAGGVYSGGPGDGGDGTGYGSGGGGGSGGVGPYGAGGDGAGGLVVIEY